MYQLLVVVIIIGQVELLLYFCVFVWSDRKYSYSIIHTHIYFIVVISQVFRYLGFCDLLFLGVNFFCKRIKILVIYYGCI